MTLDQFDKVRWTGNMKAMYRDGKTYDVGSVDFLEQLVGILGYAAGADENNLQWVRCENVEIVKL